jgi:hypothetical protein
MALQMLKTQIDFLVFFCLLLPIDLFEGIHSGSLQHHWKFVGKVNLMSKARWASEFHASRLVGVWLTLYHGLGCCCWLFPVHGQLLAHGWHGHQI